MKKLICLSLAFMLSLQPLTTAITPIYAASMSDVEIEEAEELGDSEGQYFGILDGYQRGLTNYKEDNKTESYYTTFTEDLEVYTEKKSFDAENKYYKNSFKDGYKTGYKFGYDLGIDGSILSSEDLIDIASSDNLSAGTDGASSGASMADIVAVENASYDFAQGYEPDAERSLMVFESNQSISSRYNLDKSLDDTFASDFIVAFREQYITTYESTYVSLLDTFNAQNYTYTKIDTSAGDFAYDVTLENTQIPITLSFPEGSVYNVGYIGVNKSLNPVYYNASKLIFVDSDFNIDTFTLSNQEKTDSILTSKPFTMTIQTSANDDIGIYEYKNGAWQYLYTDITTDGISHTFPAQNYSGGRYCLFIEPNYTTFDDIYFSQFYEEIYTYARRGAIYAPTSKFYPSANITRGELAYMINGILNPTNISYSGTNFTDVSENSPYKTASDFVSFNGYINGVSTTEFGLNNGITYAQLKIIIERITKQPFDMNSVFTKMQNEKFYKSKGASDMNAYVTKEEAVYILYSVLG